MRIEQTPPVAPDNVEGSFALYKRLLSYLRPLWLVFIVSILGFALYASSNAWFADLIGQLVDSIETGDRITAAERLRIPLTLLAIVLVRGVGGFFGSYFMAYIANHVVHRLRCQLVQRFLTLPASFFDRNTVGHLMSKVTYNVSQVSSAVSDALTVLLREGLQVIVLLGYLLYINWQLTLLFIAITPVISVVVLFASKKFRKHSKRMQVSMGDVTHILSETLKGMKVVRTFGAGRQVEEKFHEASRRNLRQNLKMASTQAISTPVIQLVVASALALLVWLALDPDALAAITPGGLVAYITAAGLMLKPIRQLSRINAVIQRGLAAAQSVFEVLDTEAERDTGEYEVARVRGKVEFRHAWFAYPGKPDTPVVRDVSFTCEPGRSIAIVGQSGSGKSTLVNLIPRFYELTEGRILVDDVPHTDYRLHCLREQIALVSQHVVLFNGTIRDNIAYGSLADADDAAITAALENANAMEFIRQLPDGVHTRVGDEGLLLSGGQRQRLAIARALLKDAPILILDEATSALDTASERYIQAALDKLMEGRTTFVIAHRLSTIEKADRILVMQDGRIVEEGTHRELLALAGQYAHLHELQFAE